MKRRQGHLFMSELMDKGYWSMDDKIRLLKDETFVSLDDAIELGRILDHYKFRDLKKIGQAILKMSYRRSVQ